MKRNADGEDGAGAQSRGFVFFAVCVFFYLVGAEEREHVGLDLVLSIFGDAVVGGGRLKEKRGQSSSADERTRAGQAERIGGPIVSNDPGSGSGQTADGDRIYPRTEVDDPVELHDHARFAFLESELAVFQARAGSEQVPVETAGLPDAHVALQVTAVLVFCGFLCTTKERFI